MDKTVSHAAEIANKPFVLGGPAFEDRLPIVWEALEDNAPAESQSVHAANEELLKEIEALEEHPHEIDENDPAILHELRRLDFKLNLILDVLGDVMARNLHIPPPMPVRLYAEGIAWKTESPPPAGALIRMHVYTSRRAARSLVLRARVMSSDGGVSVARFEAMPGPVSQLLDKIIFIHHRRAIAHARRTPRGPATR
jgi:hypothetical protein